MSGAANLLKGVLLSPTFSDQNNVFVTSNSIPSKNKNQFSFSLLY
jgi:hypothetical protein